MGRRGLLRSFVLVAIPALAISACGGSAATSAPVTATGTPVTSAAPTGTQVIPTPAVTPDLTNQKVVRWFVGLGSGTQPNQVKAQNAFINNFNSKSPDIFIQMEIVPNAQAYDILKTEIAGGSAPDIIGPVGVRGRNGFSGTFLDLTAQIQKNSFDLKQFPDSLVKFFNEGQNGQIGLPYLIYPGFLWYNQDLFDDQQIKLPPTKVGDQYDGKTWDWAALSALATKLTLDKNDKHPGESGFDSKNIAQWGIDFQWADGRRMASTWASGSFVGADGKATIPDGWKAAWKWYYDAMWKNFIAPKGKDISGAYLNQGATMSSGHIAMDVTWGWAINSLGTDPAKTAMKKWNIGVIPSYNGKTSSPLDADTFTIYGKTAQPDLAFKAMVAIMADKSLQQNYGGLPAKTADQQPFLTAWEADLKKVFPNNDPINWGVYTEMINNPANPSHEADMPNFLKVISLYGAFYTNLQSKDGLNVDAALTQLQKDIQAAFDQAKK